jgi:hypothetical protein
LRAEEPHRRRLALGFTPERQPTPRGAVGDTAEACKSDIREGIAAYLAELAKEGRPAPPPTAILEHIEV